VSVTAIVPLKALHHAKQRLSGRLTAGQRRALMRDVFLHVLDVCRATAAIDQIIAVVGDDAGAALAARRSVTVVHEPGGGLNHAIRHATGGLPAGTTSLIVVADLPELTVDDLSAVITTGDAAPGVLVAPTHDGGTGALLRRPPDVIAPAFGVASAAAHLRAAQQAGVRAGLIWRRGLARDIDHPADLDRYAGTVADGGELRGAWFHEADG
jgi:2-phospho-L-lactate guanylyltransferase